MKGLADLIERQGRFGDTELVHVNPTEVKILESLSPTGKLTRNPKTGKREAFIGALIASLIVGGATAAYSAKQGRKAQKKAREDQQLRDLIEGAAPNISNVQEVLPEEIQGTQPTGIEEALAAMDYEAQQQGQDVPVPGDLEQLQAAQNQEELDALLASNPELQGILSTGMMARGGPVGSTEDTYYFDVGNVMGMLRDENPQIQNVGMQLADQMTANPGMSMVPATRDQIRGMAYGGSVAPKKLADGDVVEDPMNQVIKDLLVSQIPGVSQARALKDVKEAEGLEKLVEALDLAPINPVKLGRGMKERIAARRAARRAAEEEAESRVFGPR